VQTPVTLDSNAAGDTRVTVRVRTPVTKTTVDQIAAITVRVDSTDLPEATSAQADVITITVPKA
jgi:hypothetical protein